MATAAPIAETPVETGAGSAADENPVGRLFVGNLSYDTDEASLTGAFSEFGAVESVHIVRAANNRSRGFGFVQFTADSAVDAAVAAMNGKDLDGREIRVERRNAQPSAPRPRRRRKADGADGADAGADGASKRRSLYVGNLSYDTTNDDFQSVFEAQPGFESATIAMNNKTNASKGFGKVVFDTPENASAAVAAIGQDFELDGRVLRVEISRGKRRKPKAAAGAGGAGAGAGAGGAAGAGAGGAKKKRVRKRKPRAVVASDPTKVFVGNMPYSTTKEELEAVFAGVAGVAEVTVSVSARGRPLGFGFVRFNDEAAADAAVDALTGTAKLGDRDLRIEKENRESTGRRSGDDDADDAGAGSRLRAEPN
mmetsp:Transcript_41741/g.74959  ORF Transcript_41741/g.74959 Transcript_41741/m.74959 type:complete len:367 (-) Transcript_41741:61-1161(-)|eukprot:CAMPEP_0197686694 /NCGR_PEP_ID=MMETSP1338-20131121/102875_1 /TAXON_ID=43686 ORGANISM="Pelagodinium beii, Strain RCC1491" /NCGR_SAMPLE_ID=MMETSP1338 /ASSEMBLY_ACC=CAM_ASM_000754 /LENGTH=366 /DNA_ID=CAMNT_0043268663 /DNA_START=79 /DNA_END=1179 /DNA_ORIENTATION=-